jgi:hypothetical protein
MMQAATHSTDARDGKRSPHDSMGRLQSIKRAIWKLALPHSDTFTAGIAPLRQQAVGRFWKRLGRCLVSGRTAYIAQSLCTV